MKTKVQTKKIFDSVEFMRTRRTEIGEEIQGMTFEQEKEYFQNSSELLKKYKTVGNSR